MPSLKDLKVKIYADGADREGILSLYKNEHVKGFTTNPTLMAKAGVKDYRAFAKDILTVITDRSISFEVFTDDINDMERQAGEIKTWGKNVYVKIPVTNTKGESCLPLVRKLTNAGVQLNVTAITTVQQVEAIVDALAGGAPSIVSVFAGRIADTGRDPIPVMKKCAELCKKAPKAELLWASTRELINIFQADECGCKIITVPHDIFKKFPMVDQDLNALSLDTVKQFYTDATKAGFKL
ncbi:MAG TPA: transaldolase [Planctomycetota bacterium]|nr:transaldolase [Planctomycetota bacterium]